MKKMSGLKRKAVERLRLLTDYLRAMKEKDAVQYGDDYLVVTEIINRINATRRYGRKTDAGSSEALVDTAPQA